VHHADKDVSSKYFILISTMKIFKHKILFLIISILILSYLLSEVTIFLLMTFAFIWLITLALVMIIGIYDIIKKKRNSKYLIIFFISLTLSIIFSFPLRKFHLNKKKEKAEIVIEKLEIFFEQKSKFPKSLKELNLDFETEYIYYSTDSLNTSFCISYDIDGWHTEKYNSLEKKWIGGD
ncbi:hypothetical protein, partial [Flavobacterium sp. U410]